MNTVCVLADEERAPPRRESAPYFVGPRCVFVCVCVCLCVYSRVGASYVGRPICTAFPTPNQLGQKGGGAPPAKNPRHFGPLRQGQMIV